MEPECTHPDYSYKVDPNILANTFRYSCMRLDQVMNGTYQP